MEKIARDTERDNFMSPEEAKAYGIIDEVYAEPDQSLISEAAQRGRTTGAEGRDARARPRSPTKVTR